jgi:uncharacterized protein (DUF1697 family)
MEYSIALIRGINVGGKNIVKMDALQSAMEKSGFQNVTTYIQSGNVIFKSPLSPMEAQQMIETLMYSDFGLKVAVVVLTYTDLKEILDNHPFTRENHDLKKTYFAIFSSKPSSEAMELMNAISYENEEVICTQKVAYLHFHLGFGKAKLNTNFLEKKLGVAATARNFNTLNTLVSLIEKMS